MGPLRDDRFLRVDVATARRCGIAAWLCGEIFIAVPHFGMVPVVMLGFGLHVAGIGLALICFLRDPIAALVAIALCLCYWLLPYGEALRSCLS
jgi:hypothetical protein